jgi:hypothetical protein
MFRVDADSLDEYFAFDPKREADLRRIDKLIRKAAPALKRYFHKGTAAGEPGMRFKMIGYGKSSYRATTGEVVEWPVVGLALQKNYISLYFSVRKDGQPITTPYASRIGGKRMGRNNFSFEAFADLDADATTSLIAEAAAIFAADPEAVAKCRTR